MLAPLAAPAQTPPQTGAPPFRYTDHLASVEVYSANANVSVKIPFFTKSSRGPRPRVALIYNSNNYVVLGGGFYENLDIMGDPWVMDPNPSGRLYYDTQTMAQGGGACTWYIYSNFRYYDQNGTMHPFGGWVSTNATADGRSCHTGVLSTTDTATDGSGYVLNYTVGGVQKVTNRRGDEVYPKQEDTNGNYISIAYPAGGTTEWIDGTGDGYLQTSSGPSGCTNPVNGEDYPSCGQIQVPAPGGGWSTYLAFYQNYSFNTGSCSSLQAYSGSIMMPAFLVLPEYTPGSSWYYQFGYGPAGRLTSLRYPTGATTTFSYGSMCTFGDGTVASVSVTQNSGQPNAATTTYTRNSSTQTTIARPDGSKTVIQYDSTGEPTDIKYFDTNGSTLLKEIVSTNSGGFPATAITYLNAVKFSERDTQYDSSGDLTSETDIDWARDSTGATKRIKTITYCSSCPGADYPAEIRITDGAGTVYSDTTAAYDNYASPSELVASSGAANHDSAYGVGYTDSGNPTAITRQVNGSSSVTTYFGYEDTGNLIRAVEPNGNQIATTFGNCADTYPSSRSVPGGSEAFGYDCATGLLTSATDPNGAATSFGYDAEDRLTSTAEPGGGGTTVSYPSPTETETQTKISSSLDLTRYVLADGYGRVTYRQTEVPGGSCNTVETVFDDMGRAAQVSDPYSATCGAPAAAASFTTTAFDGLGRPLSVTAPDGSVTSYAYNQTAAEITSPAGDKRILEKDGWGGLWQVCEVTSLGGSGNCGLAIAGDGYLTQYGYSPLSELTSVSQSGQSRSFSFDELGRLTAETNPESGTTAFTYGSDSTCGSSAGAMVKRVDAAGNVTCFARDPWYRVTAITYPSGPDASRTPARYFVYDAATVDGVAMVNAAGRLAEAYTEVSGAKITDEGYGYDAMGRPTDLYEMTPSSGGYYQSAESYWLDGQIETLSIPGVPLITYNPNIAGQVASVTAASGQNPVASDAFDAWGHLTGVTFGSGDADSYQFDAKTGRMTGYSLAVNGQADTGSLSWNADGTLHSLDITDPFAAGDTQNCGYTQDDLGRIATITCGAEWAQTFTPDAFGNVAVTGGNDAFPATFANNRISAVSGFAPNYNADGDLVDDPVAQVRNAYAWSAAGRPVTVDGVSQTFDALGRLVYSTESPAEFLWSPDGRKIADMSGQSLNFALVPLPGGAVAQYGSGGLYHYDHADWQGSWRLASSPGRTFIGNLAYAPFGAAYAGSGPDAFTGHWEDTPGNLNDSRYRLLAPMMARWLSPDPAGLAAVNPADPQTWDQYAYVADQPLEFTDPLGLNCDPNSNNPGTGTAIPGTGGCEAGGNQNFSVSATMPPGLGLDLWQFLSQIYWSNNCGCINVSEESRVHLVLPPSYTPNFGAAIDAADRADDIFGQVGQETNFLTKPWFYVEWWSAAGAAASGAMLAAASGAGALYSGAQAVLADAATFGPAAAAAAVPVALQGVQWTQDFAAGWVGQYTPSWADTAGIVSHDIYQSITCPPGSGQCG